MSVQPQGSPGRRFGRTTVITVALGLAMAAGTAAGQDLEERVERMERLLDSGALADLSNRQERLREEVSRLTGELDSLRQELENLRQRQRNLFQDLDDRMLELEQARESQGSRTPTAGDGTLPESPETPESEDGTGAGEPSNDDSGSASGDNGGNGGDGGNGNSEVAGVYREAFNLLRDGDYRRAADGFREVIDNYPDSEYVDNARYWLAETFYVERKFDKAMEHFQQLVDDPDSNKHPDALLKAGYIHYEREEWEQARERLEAVREQYPDTTVASLAGDRLEQMDEQGR
ncbi:tol-pal system protein YbgF [Aquisalimonas lutea]|uniref:tol-pal system protein YbgF n=1 Tax=Aquisalimonas lutea TaxID=1327750 RepID=UPI0025B3C75B|nr:tol-pal system protein YbgF [Aquisalimonas lutea]MDN3517071.1 tol-pal system protein YbgF [Aquisalimonas lutea]